MDKFHGIASAMANFDIFHAVVGYFRSSGYFKLRQELDATQEINILVGINIDNLFRQPQAAGKLFFGDKEVSLEQYCEDFLRDVYHSEYSSEVDEGIRQFCEDVSSGRLQLRIHPTKDLHAKFYLCLPRNHSEHSDGWVIMGSSNLSAQGLGIVDVASANKDDIAAALKWIKDICTVPEVGDVFDAKVVSIVEFGAFMEFLPGKEGLMHISEYEWGHPETLEGVIHVGDEFKVKVIAFDEKNGKIKLSRKALLPKPEGYVEEKPARGPRREGGDRGPRKDGDRGGHGRREGGDRGGERRSSGNGEGRRR